MTGRNYYTGCIDILTNVYDLLEKKYPESKQKVKKYRKQTLAIFRKANEVAKHS